MRHGRFFWKLFLGHLVLLAVVLTSCTWLILREFENFYLRDLSNQLHSTAVVAANALDGRLNQEHAAELQDALGAIARQDKRGIRITLIAPDGKVWADTSAEPATMSNHADRPEVIEAMARGIGESSRFSQTVHDSLHYLAYRIGSATEPQSIVRVAMPVNSVASRKDATQKFFQTIVLFGFLAAVILALALARLWTSPLSRITRAARELARGDLTARADVSGSDEIALLARSLNRMRDRLSAHLQTIDRQRRTFESLLAQLREGVILTNASGRIELVNPAAIRLLNLPSPPGRDARAPYPFIGWSIERCIPQEPIKEMLRLGGTTGTDAAGTDGVRVSDTSGSIDGDTQCRLEVQKDDCTMHVLARAADISLPDDHKKDGSPAIGRLLVVTDITDLARIIQIKSDFVANASHELRTPISTIRSAVEALNEIEAEGDPVAIRRFIGVIDRHSERLVSMVGDLLDLERLEANQNGFEPRDVTATECLESVRARFAEQAQNRGVELSIVNHANDRSHLWVHPYLLSLVLNNLVENALKFTESGKTVKLEYRRESDAAIFVVEDQGCGIPEEEQERVFERFYQVERARSGSARGTGLGLSIVRHASAAMDAKLELASKQGVGTRITVIIPQPGA